MSTNDESVTLSITISKSDYDKLVAASPIFYDAKPERIAEEIIGDWAAKAGAGAS